MSVKIVKLLAGIILSLIFLIGVGVLFLNSGPGRDWLSNYLSGYSRQMIQVDGAVGFVLSPWGVQLRDVSFAKADGRPWLKARQLNLFVPVSSLWGSVRSGASVELLDSRFDPARLVAGGVRSGVLNLRLPAIPVDVQIRRLTIGAESGDVPPAIVYEASFKSDPETGAQLAIHGDLNTEPFRFTGELLPDPQRQGNAPARVQAQLDYAGLSANLTGDMEDYRKLQGLDLRLGAGGDLFGAGKMTTVRRTFVRQNIEGRLIGDWNALTLNLERFDANTEHGNLQLSALVHQTPLGPILEYADISVGADDAGRFLEDFGLTANLKGTVSGSVRLTGARREYAIESALLDLNDGAVVIQGSGRLKRRKSRWTFDLDLEAKSRELYTVLDYETRLGWLVGSGSARGRLLFRDNVFSLEDFDARFENQEGTTAIKGVIENLVKIRLDRLLVQHDAGSVLKTRDAEDSGGRLSLALSIPEGIDSPGHTTGQWHGLIGTVEFNLDIENPQSWSGIRGDFTFRPNWSQAMAQDDNIKASSEFHGSVRIVDLKSRSFELRIEMKGSEGYATYTGRLTESRAGEGRLVVKGMNPNVMAHLGGLETNYPVSMDIESMLKHTGAGFILQDMTLVAGDSDLNGDMIVRFADQVSHRLITLQLQARRLLLRDLGFEENEEGDYYFSRSPLNLEFLNQVDLDLQIQAESLDARALSYRDIALSGNSRHGILKIESDQKLLGGGAANLKLSVDARGDLPDVKMELMIEGIDPAEIQSIRETGEDYSGDVDIEVQVEGLGDSAQDILSTADGYFLFRVNSASLPNQSLRLLSASLLLEAVRMLNPFVKQTEGVEIECGLAAFRIIDGIAYADDSIVFQGKHLLIVGKGEVDLGTEDLKLTVRPMAREGIGLNTSSLISSIGIGGSLAEPKVHANTGGLLMGGASIGAAVATGGISLLMQNMFDRATARSKQCAPIEAAFRQTLLEDPHKTKPAPEPVEPAK